MRQRLHGLGMFAESRLLSEWCRLPYLLRQLLLVYFVVAKRSLTSTSAKHALQRTAVSHHCSNRHASWPPSLSLRRYA